MLGKLREERREFERLADALIERHGHRAPIETCRRATKAFDSRDKSQGKLWRVVGRVEDKLGTLRQADAATRYLDN